MKTMIVVLLLIAVGFIVTLVYGVTHTQPAPNAGGAAQCENPLSVDEKDWCPPDIINTFSAIGRRFTKGIQVDRPEVILGANGADNRTVLSANANRPRIAKLALISGTSVRIVAKQPGKKDDIVCLCKEDVVLDPTERAFCSGDSKWIAKQGPRCHQGDTNSLTFDQAGGTLAFFSIHPAKVEVQ